jgi:hypothetical protein
MACGHVVTEAPAAPASTLGALFAAESDPKPADSIDRWKRA